MGLAAYFRLVRAGFVLAREGALGIVDSPALPPSFKFGISIGRLLERPEVKRTGRVERLTRALNRLGPTYVKFGQTLATRPDVVGLDAAADLSALQDQMEPFDPAVVPRLLAEALPEHHAELKELSAPIAAASIAQVHKAVLDGAQGRRVVLMMDSVTRYARALREIGLSVGEPAVRRGFPPSVFAELPRLFERAGNDASGSITAFYTVLAEDEDGSDPVAEETRSILDGHIVLSRQLGQAGHYPAIDVLASASRVFNRVTDRAHQDAALRVRALMAKHDEIRFLLQVGEYAPGSDALADDAIAERARSGDLVVTQDIPLAARVLANGAQAINPRGDRYTPDNIAERLSMRTFMDELRGAGVQTGGPAAFNARDRQAFASQLDRWIASRR